MARKGRPASQQPKTAYDYRRVVALVQVLATFDGEKRAEAIHALVDDWLPDVHHRGPHQLGVDYLLKLLAQHALEAAREDGDDE